jgi:hypothetical protein
MPVLKVNIVTHVAYSLPEEKDKAIFQILQTKYYSLNGKCPWIILPLLTKTKLI